jgi:hypothetical protein
MAAVGNHKVSGDSDSCSKNVDAKPCAVGLCESLGFITLEVLSGDLGDRQGPLPMCLSVKEIARATER